MPHNPFMQVGTCVTSLISSMGTSNNGKRTALQLTFRGFSDRTPALSLRIRNYTEEVLQLGETVKRRFIRRLHEDGRTRIGSTLYTEICYVEEQLVDDCNRIADALSHYGRQIDKSGLPEDVTEETEREQVRESFREKYEKLEKGPSRTE